MCGLCGIATADPNGVVSTTLLAEMRDSIIHRGPDDEGLTTLPGIGLGSRRLSIVDLSVNGRMPITSADGRYTIAYNGEVYNFRELRADLERRGHRFRTGTDTEVVLYMFAEHGEQMLDSLNGMFAIAIWDHRERKLFAARDRLGVKPLFYAVHRGDLYFASEPKALAPAIGPLELDPSCWEELLCFRYVAGEQTHLRNVKAVLPGHCLHWSSGQLRVRRWWNLSTRALARREDQRVENVVPWFAETFDNSVDIRRIADVPVGVMLSGGLDSSAVAASLAKAAGDGTHGFTVTFAEASHDEAPIAREVVARWHMVGHEIEVKRDRLLSQLRQASRLLDGPLAHANDAHMLALSQVAKSQVKVLLSGEGSDETLNGYVRYRPLWFPRFVGLMQARPLAALARHVPNSRVQKLGRMIRETGIEGMSIYNTCDVFPSELSVLGEVPRSSNSYREMVLREAATAYPGEPLRQTMYLDQHTFMTSLLDRNDRMTMGASIECRVPFLDYRLVETLASLPTRSLLRRYQPKAILRQAFGSRLPRSVLQNRKWGFGVPWDRYLREVPELRTVVEGIADGNAILNSPLDRSKVRGLIQRFLAGSDGEFALVKSLFLISVWYDGASARQRASA